MVKKIIPFILLDIFLSLIPHISFSWEIENHGEMTSQAIRISQLSQYLENELAFPIASKRFKGPLHSEFAYTPAEFGPEKIYSAQEWLIHGSKAEDELLHFLRRLHAKFLVNHNMRSVNHFYNPFWDNTDIYPYTDDGWGNDWNFQEGGLYDELATGISLIDLWMGKPLLQWANDGSPEIPPYSDFTRKDTNYFSWTYAKKYFYAALSGDSTEIDGVGGVVGNVNMNEQERDRCFAFLFRTLGQLVHLVQDAGVPEHTRNDAHPLSGLSGFENNAAKYDFNNASWAAVIPWQSIVKSDNPILDFIDANRSGEGYSSTTSTGLAEFSNYQFFTKDSIADNLMYDYCEPNCEPHGHERNRFFTHPRIDDNLTTIETGHIYNTYYYWSGEVIDPVGVAGSKLFRLAKRRWYHNILVLYGWNDYTTEDPKIWDDYLNILVPKCIGYSAAMLDYFFRGTIELAIPDDGFYALTDDPDVGFTGVKIKAKNITESEEAMTNGSVELVVKYRLSTADPFQNYDLNSYPATSDEFYYITAPEETGITTIPSDTYIDLSFDLSATPIPLWATDVYLQVIYRGQLGNEADAIAVGFKDISEPTPIDLFNNMDYLCLGGAWYAAGSQEAINYVDNAGNGGDGNGIADEWDVNPHGAGNTYYKFFPYGGSAQWPTSSNNHYYISSLAAGAADRSVYLLTDYYFNYNLIAIVQGPSSNGIFGYFQLQTNATAIFNQSVWEETEYIRYVPYFKTLRGTSHWAWAGTILDNANFPASEDFLCLHDSLE